MRRPSHIPAARAAFTVIELLVVVAIIAVLIAILVPLLSRARSSGRLAVCTSNLRQLGVATRLYANDYDGYLPRRGQGIQPTSIINRPTDWFNALPPVIGQPSYMDMAAAGRVPRPRDHSYLCCPEAADSGKPNFWSFGMNMWLSVWNNGFPDTPARFDGVGPPNTMVLMADGPGDYCAVSPAPAAQFNYSPVARHNGRVNILFLEGHVEALSRKYVGCGIGFVEHDDVRWRVPGSTWDAAQH